MNQRRINMKNKLFLRVLMLLLALCMTVSVFAACATEDDDENAPATNEEAEVSTVGDGNATEEITNDVAPAFKVVVIHIILIFTA